MIFRIATNIYYRVLASAINKKFKEYQDKGVEVAIVDYALLNTSKIWKTFDYRICIFRDYDKRVDAVMKRDGKKLEKIICLDSFSKYNIIKYGIGDVFTI